MVRTLRFRSFPSHFPHLKNSIKLSHYSLSSKYSPKLCSVTMSSPQKISTHLGILLTIVVWGLTNVSAATRAPAPAVDCSSVILNLVDCLSFVTNGSTVKKPEGSCCSGLKTVLKTNAECLCEGFKNSAQFGVSLNVTKAATLPAACKISAPSVSNCGISVGQAPAHSPMAMPPSSISGAPTTSISSDNNAAPAPSPGSSSSSSALAISALWLALTVIVASFSLF